MSIVWDTPLVLLSVLIAMIGSLTALAHAQRMRTSTGRTARVWMIFGGVTLGLAIWSMHFVGMWAFHLPVPIGYDLPLTLLSALPAIAAALLGFYVLREPDISIRRIVASSLLMGMGISVMHYTGMAAIRMSPPISYDPLTFTLSILVAIVASLGALLMMYRGERVKMPIRPRLVLGGAMMGLAISGMHYTAMLGVQIMPGSVCLSYASGIGREIPAMMVSLISLLWFGGGILAALFDQRMARQTAQALAQLEQTHLQLQARTEQVAAANARIRAIHDTVVDGIITIDEHGIVETLNPAAERIFGYAAAEVIGQNVMMLMPEPYHSGHDGYLEHYRTTGEARVIGSGRAVEVAGRRQDGSTFALELAVSEMWLAGERHFSGIVRDITARKQTEAMVARSVKELTEFKAALDQHAILVTTDPSGTITYVNDKFCAISKYARDELIGQNHRIINSGHHPKVFFGELWQTIASGGVWKGEIKNRAKDGSFYWVDTTIVPFLDEGLLPVQYIAIRADITERKDVEQALIAARNAAEQASSAKDAFLATMSHEIRTPLGGLLGMLELLSLSPLDREQDETLQTARDSGHSLLRIVNDILDWSKIEKGMLELAPQATSTAQLVAEVANTYAHVASANSVTLSSQVDARLSAALMVDPLRLSQVLNNFVSNAIKFSHGGQVELRAALVERLDGAERVRFSVTDTGIGIDPELQPRLFQSYRQGSADTARMYGGTGLGLAICRRLADMMDGRIELESAPGRGSTFSITLTLPVSDVAVTRNGDLFATTIPLNPAPDVVKTDAPLVLVVDDHPVNRRLLALQLEMLGLRVQTAEHGEAGLALWRDGRFALVITDCHMPVMDGYALTRAIRAIEAEVRPRTPIFAWTANALADEIEKCRAAGMDELLVKPADLAQLRQVLSKWLLLAVAPVPDLGPALTRQAAVAPALDVSVLKRLVGDDLLRVDELLRSFQTSSIKIAADLRAACQGGQAGAAGAVAHKLKSAARAVGALALGELCEAMEQAGMAGDKQSLVELLPGFEQELVTVAASLDSHLQQRSQSATSATRTVLLERSTVRVMVLDDEPFMLELLSELLETLGYTALSRYASAAAALDSLADPAGQPHLILLDLNMPEMDGIEFARHLAERRYAGSLVLVSGEDERTLQAAHKLVQAHQIEVLGHLQKPVSPQVLAALLMKWLPPVSGRTRSAKADYAAAALRAAIANGELVNYYQPKVALADGHLVGVETLVRWRHPSDGLVFPDQFIGVAEAHGLIDDLTRVVLRDALAQARVWHDLGLALRVAVNVSMDNLVALTFADFVVAAAETAGVPPPKVVLEVTESRLMADLRAPLEILTRLRLKRFRLSIDDFGTGHSSLAQLRDMPFDELKIDRSFVHGAHADPTLRAIFEANLNLARQLGIEVVAEGVEDRADWDWLRRSGCDLAQGYFVARPMPAAELPGWIAAWELRLRDEALAQ